MKQTLLRTSICALLLSTTLLSACAPLIIGGAAAGTALVATDRRTAGTQLEDKNIDLKVDQVLVKEFDNDTVRVVSTVYMGKVLLTGEVPDAATRAKIVERVGKVENVRGVLDYMVIAEPMTLGQRTDDNWLGSKVRTALLRTKGVPSRTIVSTTERGVVYLLGRVTQTEGAYAAAAAARVSGVQQVIKLFDYVTPEEALALDSANGSPDADTQQPAGTPAPTAEPAASSGSSLPAPINDGPEVMAID
ncbi:BON domain-containing protein [Kerstersia gyiorum]|uniref:BON domain-containing protein n=1 Tax=Kerstersia gyiorum TaxID=206506 RepID=UPI0039ED1FD0